MKHLIPFILLLLIADDLLAGIDSTTDSSNGKITLHRDALLDTLVKRHIQINKSQEGFRGYRIQLSASTERQDISKTKTDFKDMEQFEEMKAYILYRPPYFKLRVGDFRNRLEAYKHLQQITVFLPFKDAFIVQDRIKLGEKE